MKHYKRIMYILGLVIIVSLGFFFTKNIKSTNFQSISELPIINDSPKLKETDFLINQLITESLHNVDIHATSAILINAENGDILYRKNIDEQLPIASMSKMMTELIVLDAIEEEIIAWEDTIPISEYSFTISNTPGLSSIPLHKNELYTIHDLFMAMAIQSANEASIALAEATYGSEKEFVVKMNEKAKQLGLTQTRFVNTTGLSNEDLEGFYSTGEQNDSNEMSAKDVATLAKHLIDQYPEIIDITSMPTFEFQGETFSNTNWMLPELVDKSTEYTGYDVSFSGVDGIKTGFIDEAGYCFTGTVVIDNIRFISVVMGTSEIQDRFLETKKMYEAVSEWLQK